jgi:hypothetical protein
MCQLKINSWYESRQDQIEENLAMEREEQEWIKQRDEQCAVLGAEVISVLKNGDTSMSSAFKWALGFGATTFCILYFISIL